MPARKRAKGSVVKAKRSAAGTKGVRAKKARPKKTAAKKAPTRLTYGDAQSYLRKSKEEWTSLGEDMRALEELLKKLPAGEPLSAEVKRLIQDLSKRFPSAACPPYRVN